MGETFINLGIIPGDGGAWFLQRIVGFQRAAELTFSGRVFDAQEALSLGVVLEIVESENLISHVMSLAGNYAAKPPQTLRYAKQLMKLAENAEQHQLPSFLDQCGHFQGLCHNTEDHLEAVNAFIEKRQPEFKGV
jgi:enoyl-CoA hydratase/carnithine racemase